MRVDPGITGSDAIQGITQRGKKYVAIQCQKKREHDNQRKITIILLLKLCYIDCYHGNNDSHFLFVWFTHAMQDSNTSVL